MTLMMTVLVAAVVTMLVIGEDECDGRDDDDGDACVSNSEFAHIRSHPLTPAHTRSQLKNCSYSLYRFC